MRLLGRVLR